MKKDRILTVIIIIVGLLIIGEGYNIIKTLNNKDNKVVENVKTIDIFDNKDKTLSIMLQEDGINFTEATNRDAWPDIAKYTYEKAECTDSTGATVDYKTILTFNYDSTNPTTTIKTNKTVYCTLYFVKGRDTLTLLQSKGGATFKEQSGMYRFVGTTSQVLNNYICFGTTDTSECLNSPDKYMYRIIGMTKDADATLGLHANQLKIIKATPSVESQVWNADNKSDIPWDSSSVYKYLNGTFLTDAKNTRWQTGTYWDSLITSQKWYITDQQNTPTASTEPTETVTGKLGKIGLMYATDYMNAGSANTSNWLFITNGWSTNTAVQEWTMSRIGMPGSYYMAWTVSPAANLFMNNGYVATALAVRPVFYLKSSVMLSGTGISDDPFRIAG